MKIMKEHHKDLASKANIFTKYYFHLLTTFSKKIKSILSIYLL